MANLLQPVPPIDFGANFKDCVRSIPGTSGNGPGVFPFGAVDCAASEQYRLVRAKLAQRGTHHQILAVSSPQIGDGKTLTAVNLAAVLSVNSGAGVLLVDADLRRSSVGPLLGAPDGPGLRDVLRGRSLLREAIVRLEAPSDLFLLPAGEDPANPAELFDGSAWKQLCSQLRSAFQTVVIDTPPIGVVADYELVQAEVDGVILVVRPDHTNRDRFYGALKLIQPEKLVGVIYNCVPRSMAAKDSYQDYRRRERDHD